MEGDQVCHATLFEWISSPTCQQGTCIGITPAEVETRMPRFPAETKSVGSSLPYRPARVCRTCLGVIARQ